MKKSLVVALTLIVALVVVSAPAQAAIEVEGDAYIGYFDKYLWRGFDLSGGLPVIQGGVDLSAKGFTLSYWTNYQTKTDKGAGLDGGDATETDLILDYSFNPTELVSVSVGNIFYMLDGLEDTHEAYVSVGLDTILEPSLSVYYDYDEAKEDGLFFSASVGHSFDLMDKLSLSLGALVSYNQESDYAVGNYQGWHNYELSAGLDYAVTDQVSISPSFLFSSPMSDDAKQAIDSEVLGGVTVTMTF